MQQHSNERNLHIAAHGQALRMARAYRCERHLRVIYQERAADHRECLVDAMRRRQGWTLAEIVAGKRAS